MSGQEHAASRSRPGFAVRLAGFAVAWIVLWRVSALMEYAPHASIWFPPAALTLAAFIVLGWRAAPVVFACAMVVTGWAQAIYGTDHSMATLLGSGLLFAAAHGGAFAAGAAALRVLAGRIGAIGLPAFILAFLLVASAASLLAAILGVQALRFGGMVSPEEAVGLWVPWWIGDMAAAIALTPLFVGVLARAFPDHARWIGQLGLPSTSGRLRDWLLKTAVLLGLLVVVMSMTALAGPGTELLAFAVFFLILPQMWITYTESALRISLSLALFSALMALGVGVLGLDDQAMVYQFAITVIAASSYFGFSVPALVEQNRRLRQLAETDELTGVTGRRRFFECARQELATARQAGEPVSLVVFDIDRFKRINDEHGHSVGDAVLVAVSTAVRQHLRNADLFGRFGGDEFMLLLRGCKRAVAAERADEIRSALRAMPVPGGVDRVTCTFSVVELMTGESIVEAFDRADATMLAAKRAGRDRVAAEAS
jgi:diguanylate cyclase (GGDEF)-like protein